MPGCMDRVAFQQVLLCCLLRKGTDVAVGYATALPGHGSAKLRDFTTADGQPIAPSLHQLLVGYIFCMRLCYVKNREEADAGSVMHTSSVLGGICMGGDVLIEFGCRISHAKRRALVAGGGGGGAPPGAVAGDPQLPPPPGARAVGGRPLQRVRQRHRLRQRPAGVMRQVQHHRAPVLLRRAGAAGCAEGPLMPSPKWTDTTCIHTDRHVYSFRRWILAF